MLAKTLATVSRNLAQDVGQKYAKLGLRVAPLGQHRPIRAKFATSDRSLHTLRPRFTRHWPTLGQSWPKEVGPNTGYSAMGTQRPRVSGVWAAHEPQVGDTSDRNDDDHGMIEECDAE